MFSVGVGWKREILGDDVIARGVCCFPCASRTWFCVDQQLQSGLRMRLQQKNSPHIDVAHVALAKIDPNYIARNCSCILPKFRSNMSHISSRITESQM